MSEHQAHQPEQHLGELPDLEIDRLFEEITRHGDLKILDVMAQSEDLDSSGEPTLEDIYVHLIDNGYSEREIEEQHHLIKDPDGMVFALDENNMTEPAEDVYEV